MYKQIYSLPLNLYSDTTTTPTTMDNEDLFSDIDISNIIPIIALRAVQDVRNLSNVRIGSKDDIQSCSDHL